MLGQRGGLAVAILIFYVIELPFAVLVSLRHGFRREAGFVFLALLCVARIIGAAGTIAYLNESNPGVSLITMAGIMSSIGLSPLLLAMLGILGRL